MKTLVYAAALALGLFTTSTAHAAIEATKCSCVTHDDWRQAAIAQGVGTHFLYNFSKQQIRRYKVYKAPNGKGNGPSSGPLPWRFEVVNIGVPPKVQATFDAATVLWTISPTLAYTETIPINPDDPNVPDDIRNADAYDIMSTSSIRNQLRDYIDQIFSNNSFHQFLMGITAGEYFGISFDDSVISITAKVTFTDGSQVTMRIDLSHLGQAYYVPGESRDSNGNQIPEPYQYIPDRFRFSSQSQFDDWKYYIHDFLGWPLIGGEYCAAYLCHQIMISPSGDSTTGLGDVNDSSGGAADKQSIDAMPAGWQCECDVY